VVSLALFSSIRVYLGCEVVRNGILIQPVLKLFLSVNNSFKTSFSLLSLLTELFLLIFPLDLYALLISLSTIRILQILL